MSREYPARPIVGIGVAVLRPGADGVAEVLLVRRGKAPNIGSWALPGGAQDLGETAAEAARREIQEVSKAGWFRAWHLLTCIRFIYRVYRQLLLFH